MKLPSVIPGLLLTLVVVGCSDQKPASSTTDEVSTSASPTASIAAEDMPPIDDANVTLDCSTYSADAQAFVRQEADVTVSGVQYRVATIACGVPNSEVSAEVVESFVAEDGEWVSNGLVAGADLPFNTSGPCESDDLVVKCPAFAFSEEGEAVGHIEVTGQDGGLVWTFVAE